MRLFNPIFLFGICIMLISCEKNEQAEASLSTLSASNITAYSATVSADISSGGELPVLSRGFTWSRWYEEPTINYTWSTFSVEGSGTSSYSNDIPDLNAGYTYYARAYYTTARDTVYGNLIEFTTPDYIQFNPAITYGTVTDIDGNVYKTVSIGNQTWMAENLRTTRYQNGDALENVTDPIRWLGSGSYPGAYCYFHFDDSKSEIYGAYYNWAAASDPRNLAPEGWHVATEEDWKELQEYTYAAYGQDYASALRETTTAHWSNEVVSNPGFTNETGFSALGADRAYIASDHEWTIGNSAYFWTSSGSADLPIYAYLREELSIYPDQNLKGFNIRCVKD